MANAAIRRLVIVESPTKVVSLAKFLGVAYVVELNRGHVRDLPTAAAEVPALYLAGTSAAPVGRSRTWPRLDSTT